MNLTPSTAPESSDASRNFFKLVMSGELARLTPEQVAELEGTRDEVGDTLSYSFPERQVPKSIERTPEEYEAMVNWRREPLVQDEA